MASFIGPVIGLVLPLLLSLGLTGVVLYFLRTKISSRLVFFVAGIVLYPLITLVLSSIFIVGLGSFVAFLIFFSLFLAGFPFLAVLIFLLARYYYPPPTRATRIVELIILIGLAGIGIQPLFLSTSTMYKKISTSIGKTSNTAMRLSAEECSKRGGTPF
jgi:hypothetical protein